MAAVVAGAEQVGQQAHEAGVVLGTHRLPLLRRRPVNGSWPTFAPIQELTRVAKNSYSFSAEQLCSPAVRPGPVTA